MATVCPAVNEYVLLTTIPFPPVLVPYDAPAAPAATMKYEPVVPTVHVCIPDGTAFPLIDAFMITEPSVACGVG